MLDGCLLMSDYPHQAEGRISELIEIVYLLQSVIATVTPFYLTLGVQMVPGDPYSNMRKCCDAIAWSQILGMLPKRKYCDGTNCKLAKC